MAHYFHWRQQQVETVMTAVREIGQLAQMNASRLLAESRIWNKDVEGLTREELLSFIKRHELSGRGVEARESVELLLSELRACIACKEIDGAIVERYSLPEERMTLGELSEIVSLLSRAREGAVVFALAAGLTLDEVVGLRWKAALKIVRRSSAALRVLQVVPRHIRTDLVFWEYVSGKRLSPLFGLKAHFELVSNGRSFESLQRRFGDMLMIDFESDYAIMRDTVELPA
jgi:hypothetical protein